VYYTMSPIPKDLRLPSLAETLLNYYHNRSHHYQSQIFSFQELREHTLVEEEAYRTL